jgi:translation initiation factor IF-2
MPEKNKTARKATVEAPIERPPVIAVMGHVDHGKSTLLDYIRKTNVVEGEAGGITQKISAYEVVHTGKDGTEKKITFLDTPGHEAFTTMRARGANVADIAILAVSAEDGVRPQTIEALNSIKEANTPYIVAMTKMDKEGADIERTKASLAENGVFVEGYGGDISFVPVSAKTGKGIPDLLDVIMLATEIEGLTADPKNMASGIVIEANLDRKKGISASLIIKDGTLRTGMYAVAGTALSPVRIVENFLGKPIKEATFSSPVRIIGWNELPQVGSTFRTFESKKEAEQFILDEKTARENKPAAKAKEVVSEIATLPVVIKASEVGGLEAIQHEISKIKNEKMAVKIIQASIGDITENDAKSALGNPGTVILGFNTKIDPGAKSVAEKGGIEIQTFDIIYKLSEWLAAAVAERAPKSMSEESTGLAKIIRVFSKMKDKQVLGGRVDRGQLSNGAEVKIMRREHEVGRGRIRELQMQKSKVNEVPEGKEFGTLVESKTEIAPGDRIEAFMVVEK